jgi:hypothetical protein
MVLSLMVLAGIVAAMLLNVSFVNAFNAVTTVLFDVVTDGSFTASTGLFTTTVAVAVSHSMGYIQPVDGLASHNWW